ncbi:hypothetical protein ABPG72_007767 [Tetrahymena utriculariae]
MALKQDYNQQEQLISKLNFSYDPLQLFGSLRMYADLNIKSDQLKQAYYDANKKFPFQILIRGDGNCFYRSFMLSYLFTILIQKNNKEILKLFKQVIDLKNLYYRIENITQNEINFSNQFKCSFLQFWINLFIKYQTQIKKTHKYELIDLFLDYNREPFVDVATIIICRNIIFDKFQYLLTDPNYCFFITDESRQNSPKNLELYGQEAEDVIIPIAAKAFEVDLIVKNIYRINQEIFSDEYEYKFDENTKSNIVSVLFTKGHYNCLFTNEVCQIDSQAILWPQENQQVIVQTQCQQIFNNQQYLQMKNPIILDAESNQKNTIAVSNQGQENIKEVYYSQEEQLVELLQQFTCKTCNKITDGVIILIQNETLNLQSCLQCMKQNKSKLQEQIKSKYKSVKKNIKSKQKCQKCKIQVNFIKRFENKTIILLLFNSTEYYCVDCLKEAYQKELVYKPIEYQFYQFTEPFSKQYKCVECKTNQQKICFVIKYKNNDYNSFYLIICQNCFFDEQYDLFFKKLNQIQQKIFGPINNFFDQCQKCYKSRQVFKSQDNKNFCLSCWSVQIKQEKERKEYFNQLQVQAYQAISQQLLCIYCLSSKNADDLDFEVQTPQQNQQPYTCYLCKRCILMIFKFQNLQIEKKFKINLNYFQSEIELIALFNIEIIRQIVLKNQKIKN